MLLLQSSSSISSALSVPSHHTLLLQQSRNGISSTTHHHQLFLTTRRRRRRRRRRRGGGGKLATPSSSSTFVCLGVGFDQISEIFQNKVLVAAALSSTIGQLSKPFTSVFFYGNNNNNKNNNFDFKAIFQAGGFPSTHSSVAVATATCLAFERGFSDSIFGLAVVYAGLIMYDAQGVRREVGIHAKSLNGVLLKTWLNSIPSREADVLFDSSPENACLNFEPIDRLLLNEPNSFGQKSDNTSLVVGSDNRESQNNPMSATSLDTDGERDLKDHTQCHVPLKESVGHTEIEVIAGALLGFFVSLAVYIN